MEHVAICYKRIAARGVAQGKGQSARQARKKHRQRGQFTEPEMGKVYTRSSMLYNNYSRGIGPPTQLLSTIAGEAVRQRRRLAFSPHTSTKQEQRRVAVLTQYRRIIIFSRFYYSPVEAIA